MARGTQHRKRRPRPDARIASAARAKRRPEWEEQLFFSRLRSHGRWIFAVLALAFAISFVILGVGSGSTGISQVLGNFFSGNSSSGGTSLSALQQQTVKHPKSAQAWLNYANQLEADQQDDNAIAALTQYLKLRPNDQNELLDLAGLNYSRAEAWDTLYTNTEALQTAEAPPAGSVTPSGSSPLATALNSIPDPLSTAVSSQIGTLASTEYEKVIGYLDSRVSAYQKIVAITPGNAFNEYSLAQAAQVAGNTSVALTAYKAFLKLAPTNSLAPTARQEIATLKSST